jgi:hypothetical protein
MKADDFEAIPKLEKAGREVRTVVFSADENYAAAAGVAITALLQTFSPDFIAQVKRSSEHKA